MRIGELAKRAAIKVDNLRYCEKAGLLPLPPRRPNGYREYGRGAPGAVGVHSPLSGHWICH